MSNSTIGTSVADGVRPVREPDSQDILQVLPRLIQAGMGVRISGWKLAHETSRLGALGVVSSVGLRHIIIDEIRRGDEDALAIASTFPVQKYVEELLKFAPGGKKHKSPAPLDHPDPAKGDLPKRLSAICAYIEVMRSRLGHRGKVGINVMWKCSFTVLPSIYGAMLAGVDALLCGAGVPMELPDIVKRIRAGENMEYAPLSGTGNHVSFDITGDFSEESRPVYKMPALMPILSNFAFPKRMLDVWCREYGGAKPTAFILENHKAGGHNAPPRNKETYADADDIETYFDKVKALGVPIYVAGAGGTRTEYLQWTERGAYGLQVGSRFALCDESGMRREIKDQIIERNASGEGGIVTDPRVSSTGYPFKVIMLPGSLSEEEVYKNRKRICNRGYLLQSHYEEAPDGKQVETYVCTAMPSPQYEKLGGSAEDTAGRVCLCNGLMSTAGVMDLTEPPIITLGAAGLEIKVKQSARDIMEDILTPETVREMELALQEA